MIFRKNFTVFDVQSVFELFAKCGLYAMKDIKTLINSEYVRILEIVNLHLYVLDFDCKSEFES